MNRDFTHVFDEHVSDVYGFLARRVEPRSDAEDLTQLTFERALRAWPSYDPARAAPKTWLLSIARNLAIDHHRRGATARTVPVEPASGQLAAGAANDRHVTDGDPELLAALSQLGEREREVIALRYGGDLSGSEIAQLLDLTVANVHQIQSRALRRLHDTLGPGREGEAGEGSSGQPPSDHLSWPAPVPETGGAVQPSGPTPAAPAAPSASSTRPPAM